MEISAELSRLIGLGINRAIEALTAEKLLLPFAIVVADGRETVNTYHDPDVEQVLAEARDMIVFNATELELYVLVWQAELTLEGEKKQVILAEAGERGDDQAVVIAQPFSPAAGLFDAEVDGDPVILGTTDHLLL